MARTLAPGAGACVLALAAALFMLAGGRDFCLDDAWIHLAYAKSLRLGDGLSYNPGDYATGSSSPLWVLLVALLPWTSTPVLPVKLLGALCHAMAAWGTASAAEKLVDEQDARESRFRAALAGVMCAIDPALVFAAVSGMEVPLAAALIAWTVSAELAGRSGVAAALAGSAVLARPESLLFIGPWSLLRFAARRSRARLLPLMAAGAALLLWVAYCWLVSGHPFPNTYYAKRGGQLAVGLMYFALEYLPQHGWVVGITGLGLLARALVRPGESRRLLSAWLVAAVSIAGSRVLVPHVLFYNWRYFAVLGVIPCIALCVALPARRWLALLVLAPVAIASVWMLPTARSLQRAQERDIQLVHSGPARWLSGALTHDARVLVDGAGATRFFLPRSVRVIDLVGLNFGALVHAPDARARTCVALRERPTHLLLPDDSYTAFSHMLKLEVLRTFVDPAYRIGREPRIARVIAAHVIEIEPYARSACGLR